MRSYRRAWSLLLLCLLARPAGAVRPEERHRRDVRRFGLDRLPQEPSARRPAALSDGLRRIGAQGAGVRVGPAGAVRSLSGLRGPARAGTPEEAALAFLRENRDWLGVDPAELRLELLRESGGLRHLLFQQVHRGLPVEFARLKLHLGQAGEVLGMQSGYRPGLALDPVPAVSAAQAAAVVAADAGASSVGPGELVFYPRWQGGELRLAWRLRAGGGARWVYYVDAKDGTVLFRYDEIRHQCQTQGTIHGEVFDVDPNSTPGPVLRPMPHNRVHVVEGGSFATTGGDGNYCHATRPGKVFSSLQGPYAHVSNFTSYSAHYDNGGGVWSVVASPISSPHPYPNDAVLTSTVNAPAGAVKVLPRFSTFDVGSLSPDGDIIDADVVEVVDSSGNAVATYLGSKSAFLGAAVAGPFMRLRLRSNSSGQRNGYDVNISSYLSLTLAPTVPDAATSTFTWTSARTSDGSRDEINLFYHLNKMHDYFMGGVNSSSAAFISKPVVAMARVGPNLANAFYDPVYKFLGFGDVGNGFALDATVVRHEYVHFVVDQVFPVINFGQGGAVSEAVADYFSASSLGVSSIGRFTSAAFGGVGALRELDCPTNTTCRVFPTNWSGEIHEDSLMVSQALWRIRQDLVSSLGATNGRSCADSLLFRSLLFFPDSFQELLDAMLQVSSLSATLAPACGANGTQNGLVEARFSSHGIVRTPSDEDVYEPNDGVQTATDISTRAAISARIFPGADQDFYAIGAGEGLVRARLTLPENPGVPGGRFAYGMVLFNDRFEAVQTAYPRIDVNPTLAGFCPAIDCMTSDTEVLLEYQNPARGPLFLLVSAAPADNGSNSRTSSTRFYGLSVSYNQTGPVSGGIVTAAFDRDTISYSVRVSTFASLQNHRFRRARLLDHSLTPLPDTATDDALPYLVSVSSTEAGGRITGTLRLRQGFASRFPAVGTVHLELFGFNPLGHVQSLGLSNALQLTANTSELTAYNNVFNPARGEKATFKYQTVAPGQVTLRLYTLAGAHVLTLIDSYKPAGKGSVDWHGVNLSGRRVASGIYYLHLDAPGIRKTQKVIVVK